MIRMNLINIVLLLLGVWYTAGLPLKYQLALTNSLEVGRMEDPMDWTCWGCTEENKPISSRVIQ